jgi:tRNA modification GTPase
MPHDTIFALSSGRPPAGVALIRLSGPHALATVEALTGRSPEPRIATVAALRDPASGALLDHALVLTFAAPASFTGEDVAELHVHGGQAVIAAVLRTLGARPGLRLAEPGEFSRRAFDNHKLDLTQAEGLADLIGAATEAQRVQALAQADGRIRARVEGWRDRLLRLQASAEADLDFSDEADVTVSDDRDAIAALQAELAAALRGAAIGERIRDGFTIAVIGSPNVGKSSLINALAERDAAIVSDVPGTTRDAIELLLDIAGIPVMLVDTAGLRDTQDPVEAEGIRRARARAGEADLVLHVTDDPAMPPLGQLVINKVDMTDLAPGLRDGILYVSARSGAGLDALRAFLADWLAAQTTNSEATIVTQQRHRVALGDAAARLDEAAQQPDPVLRAEALRLTARALGRITGRVGVEDMLDTLFGRFCIGK